MATAAEIVAKTAKYLVNVDRLDLIINGPASGADSVVSLDSGDAKTLSRILAEMIASPNAEEWDSTKAYAKGAWVIYLGETFYAKKDVPAGIVPVEGEYWGSLGTGVVQPADLAVQALQIAQDVSDLMDEANSQLTEIRELTSQAVSDAQEAISSVAEEAQARADAITAESAARAEAITAEIQARANAILALQPVYDNTKTYAIGDVVFYNGKIYQAVAATIAHAPTDTTYWVKVGDYGTLASGLAAQSIVLADQGTRLTTVEGVTTATANSLTSLTTRMTNAEGVNTSQATALTSLDTRVTAAENVNTSQATSITSLTSSLNNKADATAVTALTTRVTAAENSLVTQANSITSLTASLADTGSDNPVYNPSFDIGSGTVADGWISNVSSGVTAAYSLATSEIDANGKMQCIAFSGLTGSLVAELVTALSSTYYISATAGETSTQSVYVKATAGTYLQIHAAYGNASGDSWTTVSRLQSSTTIATGAWQRIPFTTTVPTGTSLLRFYCRALGGGTSAGTVYWDRAQFEKGSVATAWRNNILATGSAVTSLDTRVSAVEGVNTSQATSLTSLTTRMTNAEGVNTSQATALTSLDTRVTAAENVNTSQATSITSLTSSLNNKADATAVTALTTRVTAAETTLVNQASSITSLTTRMTNAEGVNTSQATALTSLDTRVTAAENVNTSQATSITSLTTRMTSAENSISATGTAVTNLTTRVTAAETTISSLSAAVTQVSSDLVLATNTASVLPSDFSGGLTNWTGTWEGAPNSVASATGSIVSDTYGPAYSVNWTSSSNSVLTKGCVQVRESRIYEIKARCRVTASDGSVSLNVIVVNLSNTYANLATQTLAATTVTGTGAVTELTCRVAITADSANNVTALAASTRYLRYGLRLNSTETGLTLRILSISCVDVTDSIVNATATTTLTTRVTATESVNTAQATSISSLSTTVAGHTSSITSISSLQTTQTGQIVSLQARAAVLLDVNGRITGWEISSNGTTGTASFVADKFSIVGAGGTPIIPFTVDTVNNVVQMTNVIVDTLQIKSGALTNMNDSIEIATSERNTSTTPYLIQADLTTIGGTQVMIDGSIWITSVHNSTFYLNIYRIVNGTASRILRIPNVQGGTQRAWPIGFRDTSSVAATVTYAVGLSVQDGSDTLIQTTYMYLRVTELKR